VTRAIWRGRAFGLDLEGDFDQQGVIGAASSPAPVRPVALCLVSDERLSHAYPLEGAQPLVEADFAGARSAIHALSDGFLLEHEFYGRFGVRADGGEALCAPGQRPAWIWQRFLGAQVLPLAAALQGLEPLHASCVARDGAAILLGGTSGGGKTSVALHLAVLGGSFMCDDVTALEVADGQAIAHAGSLSLTVDAAEIERLPTGMRDRWVRLGTLDGEERVAAPPSLTASVPVARLYVLTRRDDASAIAIERDGALGPEGLLGMTFNAWLSTPERRRNQLELAGLLDEGARPAVVTVPMSGSAREVAAAIEEDLDGSFSPPPPTPAASRRTPPRRTPR